MQANFPHFWCWPQYLVTVWKADEHNAFHVQTNSLESYILHTSGVLSTSGVLNTPEEEVPEQWDRQVGSTAISWSLENYCNQATLCCSLALPAFSQKPQQRLYLIFRLTLPSTLPPASWPSWCLSLRFFVEQRTSCVQDIWVEMCLHLGWG